MATLKEHIIKEDIMKGGNHFIFQKKKYQTLVANQQGNYVVAKHTATSQVYQFTYKEIKTQAKNV